MRSVTFQLGKFRCDLISDGTLWLDGGTMFGVVPRTIWQKVRPPDEQNRVRLGANSLLLRNGKRTILVETGIGSKPRQRRAVWHSIEAGHLLEGLAGVGCQPESVDLVILTHLHWDHCGGSTSLSPDGPVVPTFPHARTLVQRMEWEDARQPTTQTRDGYLPDDFLPLAEFDRLELVEGDVEVAPGVYLWLTGGHVRGHQTVVVRSEGKVLCYPGDIMPTAAHVRPSYVSSYDLYPVESHAVKEQLVERACREEWLLAPGHDDDHPLIRLVRRDDETGFEDVAVM